MHSVTFLFLSTIVIIPHAIFPFPQMNQTITDISTYSHSYRTHMYTRNHLLHPHKLVAKVNYDMFKFQSFRLWQSHAAATKLMVVETTRAFVKLKQAKAAMSAGGMQFVDVDERTRYFWVSLQQRQMHVTVKCNNAVEPNGLRLSQLQKLRITFNLRRGSPVRFFWSTDSAPDEFDQLVLKFWRGFLEVLSSNFAEGDFWKCWVQRWRSIIDNTILEYFGNVEEVFGSFWKYFVTEPQLN